MSQEHDIERIKEIKARHEQNLLKRANVVGVGIGYKCKSGRRTSEVVIVVNVSDKKPVTKLASQDIVPAELEGVPVDVQEVGKVKAL